MISGSVPRNGLLLNKPKEQWIKDVRGRYRCDNGLSCYCCQVSLFLIFKLLLPLAVIIVHQPIVFRKRGATIDSDQLTCD